MAVSGVLYLYWFGRPRDEIAYTDINSVIVVAPTNKIAKEIYKKSRKYDPAGILKKKIKLDEIRPNSILIQ